MYEELVETIKQWDVMVADYQQNSCSSELLEALELGDAIIKDLLVIIFKKTSK